MRAFPSSIYLGNYVEDDIHYTIDPVLCGPTAVNQPASDIDDIFDMAIRILKFSQKYEVQIPIHFYETVSVINPKTNINLWKANVVAEIHRSIYNPRKPPKTSYISGGSHVLSANLDDGAFLKEGAAQFIGVLKTMKVPGFLKVPGTPSHCPKGVIVPVYYWASVKEVMAEFKRSEKEVANLT